MGKKHINEALKDYQKEVEENGLLGKPLECPNCKSKLHYGMHGLIKIN